MNTIWIIIQREYITRVRKRSFIIATLLAPLGLFAFAVFSVFIASYSSSDKHVAIVDQSGLFNGIAFADADDGSVLFHVEQDTTGLVSSDTKTKKSRYDALIVIPPHYDLTNPQRIKINCYSDKNIGLTARSFIDKTLTDKIRLLRAEQLHLSEEQLEDLQQDVSLKYENLHADVRKTLNAEVGAAMGYLMGMVIYILLLVYGSMIMKGVAEEKSSRIMEVLVSSVKPIQLMVGKIVGVGAVGLTQFILWIILSSLTMLCLPLLGLKAQNMQHIAHGTNMRGADFDPDMVQQYITTLHDFHFGPLALVLLLFFIGGFLLYGSLFAAIGAAGTDETNAQSLTFPVMMPVILSFLLLTNVLTQPEGKVAFIGSLVPFCSPILMPALMPFNPPIWHILLSLGLLIGGFLLCVALAAKIYRTGILMYGKKVTFREMMRWVMAGS